MSSDTLFAKVKSLQGNTCAQLYTTGKYIRIMPLPDKTAEGIGYTLLDILNTVGIPREMVTDLASKMVGRHTKFRKELIKRTQLGHCPTENPPCPSYVSTIESVQAHVAYPRNRPF
jgi:hypothetical protein